MSPDPLSPDPRDRFSDRVADYVRSRPSYPPEVVQLCRDRLGLPEHGVVVDLGSGTGILSRLFVEQGYRVIGVEPNEEMAAAARAQFDGSELFVDQRGSAEDTDLPEDCADLVVAGQAFHWFQPERARDECRRILKPDCNALLIWNLRPTEASPFMAAYESFLGRWGTDYAEVGSEKVMVENLQRFFGPEAPDHATLPNHQDLDREGLVSRVLSCSYMPGAEHPKRANMLKALDRLFKKHQQDGKVRMHYNTELYWGQPAAP